ncbi:MAG: TSUP family transporter [Acidimicrobiales bacterium]
MAWAVAVLIGDFGDRVVSNWESTATMLFVSFLAGSSPEGGGAVAFPVFTKVLEVPGPVARTFGLCIQAVGMTMATISILLSGRRFHARAAVVGSIAGVVGFVAAVFLVGERDQLFWPSAIGTPWVKATFSIVLATTSVIMVLHLRHGDDAHTELPWNRRLDIGLIVVALAGGLLASLTGTGTNILVFLFLVALADVLPKTALPTAIIVMTAVSVVGLVVFGVIDGQLDVQTVDDRVVAVGGQAADLDAGSADLLGLWLAAVPVVVWGAPLGSFAASLVREDHLVRFVAVLATIEVVTTFLLVSELRTDAALIAYMIVGLLVLPAGLILMRRNRRSIFS